MCEFLSCVKAKDKKGKDKWYFLTHDRIHNTPRGEIIQKKYPGVGEVIGHSAIREYYHLRSGKNWECLDFSTPKNFPAIIVNAIKRGEFRGFGTPAGLLSFPLDDKYQADRQTLDDKYQADLKPLYDKYWADRQTLDDKYRADRQTLDDKYQADLKTLDDKYWDLFADPKNRAEAWR